MSLSDVLKDRASADYSQQTELRFIVLSQLWVWDEVMKKDTKSCQEGREAEFAERMEANSEKKQGERDNRGMRRTDIPPTPAAPGPWVGGRQRHRVAEDPLTSHFSWMEPSDAERTRLKEQRRGKRSGRWVEPFCTDSERRSKEERREGGWRRRSRGGCISKQHQLGTAGSAAVASL